MTLAAGAAAGSGPAIACATSHVCDGVSGTVTVTTGTSPTTGTLATLTFPITVTANSAPAASTAYTVRYWCGGD
jgi:hypothetical protein